MSPCARCGHPRTDHKHWRAGTNCSVGKCACHAYVADTVLGRAWLRFNHRLDTTTTSTVTAALNDDHRTDW